MSTTHIAGTAVKVGTRLIQRCALCGEKLIDRELSEAMVPVEDAGRPIPTWKTRGLVRVDGALSSFVEHNDGDDLPEDSCLELVEN